MDAAAVCRAIVRCAHEGLLELVPSCLLDLLMVAEDRYASELQNHVCVVQHHRQELLWTFNWHPDSKSSEHGIRNCA